MRKKREKLEDFCNMYLAHISDDDTIKYKVHISDIALLYNSFDNTTRVRVADSPRFNCIEIYRERTRRLMNYGEYYNRKDEIPFKWSDVQEDLTQFIFMCEHTFGLTKRQSPIIFTNWYGYGKDGAVSISIDDLDDLDPDSTFYKIYINIID